jgi:hypothetical protein
MAELSFPRSVRLYLKEIPWFSVLLDAEGIPGLQNVARKNRSIENKIMYKKPTFFLSIVELNSYTDEKAGGLLEHRCEVKETLQHKTTHLVKEDGFLWHAEREFSLVSKHAERNSSK